MHPREDGPRSVAGHPSDRARRRARTALNDATRRLAEAGLTSPAADARALVSHAARATGPLVMLDVLPQDFDQVLARALERREQREPLQLILGSAPFRRLEVEVAPGVFIPRPETETAVDLVLDALGGPASDVSDAPHASDVPHAPRVVDLCTGSGAIAAALLDEHPRAQVTAVELEDAAVALATRNIDAVDPLRGRVLQADVTEPDLVERLGGAGSVDVVVANPPYIPADAVPEDPEVHAHDPHRALFGGGMDGLDVPRAVIALAARLLRPGGVLVMEHADVQGPQLRKVAAGEHVLTEIRTVADLTGRDRFLSARALRPVRAAEQ